MHIEQSDGDQKPQIRVKIEKNQQDDDETPQKRFKSEVPPQISAVELKDAIINALSQPSTSSNSNQKQLIHQATHSIFDPTTTATAKQFINQYFPTTTAPIEPIHQKYDQKYENIRFNTTNAQPLKETLHHQARVMNENGQSLNKTKCPYANCNKKCEGINGINMHIKTKHIVPNSITKTLTNLFIFQMDRLMRLKYLIIRLLGFNDPVEGIKQTVEMAEVAVERGISTAVDIPKQKPNRYGMIKYNLNPVETIVISSVCGFCLKFVFSLKKTMWRAE